MSEVPAGEPIDVLLVEDDPGDVLMTQEAFKDYKIANNLHVVTNGEDAIAYLRREGTFADVPVPDLVLLDLNLPRRDGREVLREIKNDRGLRRIPIVVLTTSNREEDVLESYDLHAAGTSKGVTTYETGLRITPGDLPNSEAGTWKQNNLHARLEARLSGEHRP